MTVFPYARFPYGRILLYTPICSRHLTIASGVHGRIDFTVPSEASVTASAVFELEAIVGFESVFGSTNRILGRHRFDKKVQKVGKKIELTCDRDYSGI